MRQTPVAQQIWVEAPLRSWSPRAAAAWHLAHLWRQLGADASEALPATKKLEGARGAALREALVTPARRRRDDARASRRSRVESRSRVERTPVAAFCASGGSRRTPRPQATRVFFAPARHAIVFVVDASAYRAGA